MEITSNEKLGMGALFQKPSNPDHFVVGVIPANWDLGEKLFNSFICN
ncbi:hypothetical protein GCM10020331_037370 [Ectobacillus funiculus]